ncbi:MAM and LDL-receptor class A domain-containing protein 2, partial [Armadillidium vulgare]
MSDLLESDRNNTAWLLTTPTKPTEARGRCLTFQHASAGLSVDSFGVYLFLYHDDSVRASDIDSTIEDVEDENMNFTEPLRIVRYDVYPLIEIRDTTEGLWATVKISISSNSVFSIAFKGKSNHHYSLHRGYVAIDSITFQDGPCGNDCTFDSDFCAWENPTDEEEDDFDWSLARSTMKRGTGPSRDQSSSVVYHLKTVLSSKPGGYAYINSGYPQKSGDKARLESPEIAATEVPLCMMFWVHMYGGGIGSLHVLRQIGNEEPVQLWVKRDTNGLDRWNPSQLTVTAPANQKYKVIFQADVGERGSGDIALDSIAFREGPCPQLPPGSSETYSRGDCTFLINTCEWRLQQPPTLTTSFTPMLKQISESYTTPPGKTQVPFVGEDYYMSFELGNYKHRIRDKAYLISPTIPNDINGICLSFWVHMFTNVPTETSVGALTAYSRSLNLFRNSVVPPYLCHKMQKEMECILPEEAFTTIYDCTFDSDQCRWKVETEKSLSPPPEARDRWRYADYGITLNILMDHTYGMEKWKIHPTGFMFIEALNDDVISKLVSPTVEGQIDMCMSFFYASFFSDNTAELNVT